ncbi:hypothetical protein VTK73DRAFT_685 [Phialemonium thermophilum]|uniref:Uncharacterized protein n=1 Tax=Phialemonium thermophilum TaxID=223376 RepID=A0ABR3VUH6_9PEZI
MTCISCDPVSSMMPADQCTCPFPRRTSTASSGSEIDADAITPCETPTTSMPQLPSCTCQAGRSTAAASPAGSSTALDTTAQQNPDSRRRSESWRAHMPRFDPMRNHRDGPVSQGEALVGRDPDPEVVWRRMLVMQRLFGCYNSARMDAALELGEESAALLARRFLFWARPCPLSRIPRADRSLAAAASQTGLDLLNDSIGVAHLPDEAKRRLDEYLEEEAASSRKKKKRV